MKKMFSIFLIAIILFEKVHAFYDDTSEVKDYEEEIIEIVSLNDSLVLNSKNAILYDNTYNQVLYEKNAYVKVPNASTTKILTAIVAYENCNMDSVVTISKKAASIGRFCNKFKNGR